MSPHEDRTRSGAGKRISAIQARIALLTYALSRLPPRQLPLLAIYASGIVYASEKGWITAGTVGKAGVSIVGVLSMVTGLFLSHRFSSAVSTWEEGKKVWVAVRTDIRDAIRLISVIPPSAAPTPGLPQSPPSSGAPTLISMSAPPSEMSSPRKPAAPVLGRSSPKAEGLYEKRSNGPDGTVRDPVVDRVDELAGLFVGFAFALQHHLHGTRPLPQPPLCDLLPQGYLASLKRTEARVRFAEDPEHDEPTSTSLHPTDADEAASDSFRPGLRRRGTGPPTSEERQHLAGDEWELSNLKEKAEDAVSQLAEAVAGLGGADDNELLKQLDQLHQFPGQGDDDDDNDERIGAVHHSFSSLSSGEKVRTKSNLANPTPPNLPLAILKLMEAYLVGLAEVPVEKGGWSEAKRDKGLGIVKSLSEHLSEAERLASTPPPLSLTLHSYHLLTIYLTAIPPSLLCAISGLPLILITLLAGWCLLGLEALVDEVGGVFGGSEAHHPLPVLTLEILGESLDMCPGLAGCYRGRVAGRVGKGDGEVGAPDRRRRGRSGCRFSV